MSKLFIEGTKSTPRVEFLPSGELSIQGRSLPEDPHGFYNPLLDWVNDCNLESVTLDIRLEYINTSSSKQIYTLVSNLASHATIKEIMVNWHYEEGDEDGYEAGKEFEAMTKLQFTFHEYAETLA